MKNLLKLLLGAFILGYIIGGCVNSQVKYIRIVKEVPIEVIVEKIVHDTQYIYPTVNRDRVEEGIDYRLEVDKNSIKNQSIEYQLVEYYKNGEKIEGEIVAKGNVNSVVWDSQTVLNKAKELGVDNVKLIHNHPSQNTNFSEQDRITKEKLDRKFNKEGINVESEVVVPDRR
jgi:DNA repair protein RadC